MKKLMYVATVALMASGMVWAQSSISPSTQDTQNGSSTTNAPQTSRDTEMRSDVPCEEMTVDPSQRPGAMGAPVSANQGTNPKDATSGKCLAKDKKSASDNKKYDDYDAAERAEAGRR
jgi:hypothetical protein